ncbi:MAG: hypothetical protein QXY99_00105 [Thermoproteota archaeon]
MEKVDLSAGSYRLDFYLWFRIDPSEISLEDVKEFEFVNGFPTKYEVKADADNGYLEYRVRGDFIKTFDFSRYPFEMHTLTVELEHKKLNASYLIFTADPTSNIDKEVNVAGWARACKNSLISSLPNLSLILMAYALAVGPSTILKNKLPRLKFKDMDPMKAL